MNRYLLELSKSALKFLNKSDRKTIINVLHALTENPYSYPGTIKLTGFADTFRIRIGKYRIIYQVLEDDSLIVFIQDIDSRGDIYKHL